MQRLHQHFPIETILRILLGIGALFFLSEFLLHFFGLPILEHDRIFLPTHDRYIALYGLTHAALLVLCAIDLRRYRVLLGVTLAGILLAMLNALWISRHGGYATFDTHSLDHDLTLLGVLFAAWYLMTLSASVMLLRSWRFHVADAVNRRVSPVPG